MRSISKTAIFAAAAFSIASALSSSAYAVTTHRRVHRVDPPPDVVRTMVQPGPEAIIPRGPYGGSYGGGADYDDPAFDSPWDPGFGRGRTPGSGGSSGGV